MWVSLLVSMYLTLVSNIVTDAYPEKRKGKATIIAAYANGDPLRKWNRAKRGTFEGLTESLQIQTIWPLIWVRCMVKCRKQRDRGCPNQPNPTFSLICWHLILSKTGNHDLFRTPKTTTNLDLNHRNTQSLSALSSHYSLALNAWKHRPQVPHGLGFSPARTVLNGLQVGCTAIQGLWALRAMETLTVKLWIDFIFVFKDMVLVLFGTIEFQI